MKKNLEFFVFHNSLTIILSKKQKTLSIFSCFKVKTKKKLGKTKKNKHEPQTKHSLKSFVFLFFGFLEVLVIVFPKIQPKSRKP